MFILLCTSWTAHPRGTVIGSAWKEAQQRVYLKSGDTSGLHKPAPYVSTTPPPPPAPPAQTAPHHIPQSSAKMNIIEPSPEEMHAFFSNLEALLSASDEELDEVGDLSLDQLFTPPSR